MSQRGFYPDDREKANQDSYSISTNFDDNPEKALFMVFDGHGKEGDKCANFCRDQLPANVRKELRTDNSVEDSLTKAFLETNVQLHMSDGVDDSLSGSTAVGMYINGPDMFVANVGDSRAIICQDQGGKLVAKPLSSDQTPYRKDERERVKLCGARVMSMDQIEGLEPMHENWGDVNLGEELDEGGDPPRIWSPFGEYPGTAFTRSMGDQIAEELGVSADPEIIHRRVHPQDRFVVVASDGVFEFLTNQMVVDMVALYDDPLVACKKIVQEAYDLWLQYEVRTDDITIIVMHISDIRVDDDEGLEPNTDVGLGQIALEGVRPVRREMTRERRRELILGHESFAMGTGSPHLSPTSKQLSREGGTGRGGPSGRWGGDGGGDQGGGGGVGGIHAEPYSIEDNITPKTQAERESILNALKSNFLFEHISEQQREVLLQVIKKVQVKKGDWVIRQGGLGDKFYIIESGQFEVRVNEEKVSVDDREDAGMTIHTYQPTDSLKPCFGHLALLYSKPRTASVFATTDGELWALDRPVFRNIIMKKSRRELARVLRRVEVLRSLTLPQLHQLCDVLTEKEYAPGEVIISQGQVGDKFYILEEGTAVVSIKDDGSKGGDSGSSGIGSPSSGGGGRVIRKMRQYEYFGERALLTQEPRSATVTAEHKVVCLELTQKAFEERLGSLQYIIDEDRRKREMRPIMPSMEELRVLGTVLTDDLGQWNLVKMPNNQAKCTLRTMWKSRIVSTKQRDVIDKSVDVLNHVTEHPVVRMGCVAVPFMLRTYNSEHAVHILEQSAVACSLQQIVLENGPLPSECVRYLAACIVLGLETIHKANVLYRALSPELVYLDSKGNAVLMDFRLSKLSADNESSFTLCGTPEYLAPEQVRHQGHGKAVDFWALGILLYELIEGSSPFHAGSELEIFNKISAHKQLTYPTTFAPALQDFLDRLLHPVAAQRLGARGAVDIVAIKTHQWFAGFDWAGVAKGDTFNQELRSVAYARIQNASKKEEMLDPSRGGGEGSGRDGRDEYSGAQEGWSHF